MPKIALPAPPLALPPTFRRGEVLLADGRIARKDELPSIARWTGLKLYVHLEQYPFEWAQDRAPRVAAVRALIATFARASPWKHMHVALGSRAAPPSRPFSKKAFDDAVKKVALQRFNANAPAPLVIARTGGPDDLQYEWSLVVSDCTVHVFAHDTPANRASMEKLFVLARRAHDAAIWATSSHGYGGSLSYSMLGLGSRWGLRPAFFDHDEAQLTPPWRMHIGRSWLVVPSASKRIDAFVKKQKATRDPDGLLFAQAPPRSATDRSAPRRAAWRAFSTLRKLAGKDVNTAFHDAKLRKELGLAPAK